MMSTTVETMMNGIRSAKATSLWIMGRFPLGGRTRGGHEPGAAAPCPDELLVPRHHVAVGASAPPPNAPGFDRESPSHETRNAHLDGAPLGRGGPSRVQGTGPR